MSLSPDDDGPRVGRDPAGADVRDGTVVAAGAIIYRKGKGFLLLRNRDYWEFPKGRADADDPDIVATALREVREESGLTDVALVEGFRDQERYRVARGPKTVDYFVATTAQDPRISDEHRGFCWCTPREVVKFVSYETKRAIFRRALHHLKKTGIFDLDDENVRSRSGEPLPPRQPRRRGGGRSRGSGSHGSSNRADGARSEGSGERREGNHGGHRGGNRGRNNGGRR